MNITDVRLKKADGTNSIKAVASITFDESFVVHGLRVIQGESGLFVVMPSKKTPAGEFKDIAHPLHQNMRDEITKKVLEAYEQAK